MGRSDPHPALRGTGRGSRFPGSGQRGTKTNVLRALGEAKPGPVAEGSVGAGTGTTCFGWKGGIGTSSRVLPTSQGGHVVGVLVQTNYGGQLKIGGVPVARVLTRDRASRPDAGGSCMIVVATDAPVDAHGLGRIARRATLALGRTGSVLAHGSGDHVIAFSTAASMRPSAEGRRTPTPPPLRDDALTPLFQATSVSARGRSAFWSSLPVRWPTSRTASSTKW
jgi:D-aminopeptidase